MAILIFTLDVTWLMGALEACWEIVVSSSSLKEGKSFIIEDACSMEGIHMGVVEHIAFNLHESSED